MFNGKIFLLGLSRTGTTSACTALEIMGVKTLHYSLPLFFHLGAQLNLPVSDPSDLPKRSREKVLADDAEQLLENHQAFGDLPIPLFYKFLDEKYPGSKFIYTFRNKEKWLQSMDWMLTKGSIIWDHGQAERELNQCAYGTKTYHPEKLLASYQSHHKDVLSYFESRPEDLLTIDTDKGELNFERIASFLDMNTPEGTIPHSNYKRNPSFKNYCRYYAYSLMDTFR